MNLSNRIDYLLIATVLLAIACLLMFVVIVVKYHMKRELKKLHTFYHISMKINSASEIDKKNCIDYFFDV